MQENRLQAESLNIARKRKHLEIFGQFNDIIIIIQVMIELLVHAIAEIFDGEEIVSFILCQFFNFPHEVEAKVHQFHDLALDAVFQSNNIRIHNINHLFLIHELLEFAFLNAGQMKQFLQHTYQDILGRLLKCNHFFGGTAHVSKLPDSILPAVLNYYQFILDNQKVKEGFIGGGGSFFGLLLLLLFLAVVLLLLNFEGETIADADANHFLHIMLLNFAILLLEDSHQRIVVLFCHFNGNYKALLFVGALKFLRKLNAEWDDVLRRSFFGQFDLVILDLGDDLKFMNLPWPDFVVINTSEDYIAYLHSQFLEQSISPIQMISIISSLGKKA